MEGFPNSRLYIHITFQCSEQVLIKLLKHLLPLRELVLCIAHPSPSWQNFLESLAAKPSTNEWPPWGSWGTNHQQLEQWCYSQTWRANVLPHLEYLGIQCPKGFSLSECFDNRPILRLAGWTRSHMTPPLEHLKVWEGRTTDDIVVDYISTDYLDKHHGISSKEYDAMIVMGVVTRCLVIHGYAIPLLQLDSTALFRRLQHLELTGDGVYEFLILPCLEQIKGLEIWFGIIPVHSLDLDLPLTRTLHWLKLHFSTSSWMLGRTFEALREFQMVRSPLAPENLSGYEGLQTDLPVCTRLELKDCPMDYLRFFSCSNVQILRWWQTSAWTTFDFAALVSSHGLAFDFACLQNLDIVVPQDLGLDSLIHFVLCGAWEQRVWRDIRNVGVEIQFNSSSEASHFIDQIVGQQQRYGK